MTYVHDGEGLWLSDTHPLAEVVRHMLHIEAEWGWRYAGWNGHGTAVTVQFDAPVRLRVVERGEDLEIPGWPE